MSSNYEPEVGEERDLAEFLTDEDDEWPYSRTHVRYTEEERRAFEDDRIEQIFANGGRCGSRRPELYR